MYKDKEQAKEAARLRMQKMRKGVTEGVTSEGVTLDKQGVTSKGVTLLHRPNGADYDPTERLYGNPCYADGALRYLGPMTDGQCLDRLTVGGV